jgi:hypothetical protein
MLHCMFVPWHRHRTTFPPALPHAAKIAPKLCRKGGTLSGHPIPYPAPSLTGRYALRRFCYICTILVQSAAASPVAVFVASCARRRVGVWERKRVAVGGRERGTAAGERSLG